MRNFRWIIDNPNDTIQRYLANDEFFEREELKHICTLIREDDCIIDVGSNVGNHCVFLSKFSKAKTIYAIEPIPRAYQLLLANIALNYCHNVNVDFVGLALGHFETVGYPFQAYGKDNLGSTTLFPEPVSGGLPAVKIVTGDSLFEGIEVNFIKIDVEGMEIEVLEGFTRVIDKYRPRMFIEVMDQNLDRFKEWIDVNQYIIVACHDEYSKGIFANYTVFPKTEN